MCVCACVCAVGKMAEDTGMTIRKSIVVSFLPCLVAFFGIPSLYVLSFFTNVFCYLFLLLFWGEKTMDRCGCTAAACSYIHRR